MIRLYNTKTRTKVDFETLERGKVGMYVCGPTVYNYIHIGNARTFISFDVIRRYLMWRGFDVTFVQNVTDVDDKIIGKSLEEGRSAAEVAAEYTEAFIEDMRAAGVLDPDIRPKATEEIPAMIELIQELIDGGHAYDADGDVYFNVRSFPAYGELSGRNVDEMESGHRELRADGKGVEDRKRDPLDFALWKAAKPGEPAWESPWGMGRPGWHIECSAMSTTYLGETFDIHGGGKDLLFPHHENEIAQTSGATGKPYVRYWMHNGFINIDNEKMSKSKGNFFTVRDISREFDLEAVRLFMLSAHYRSPINFSRDLIEAAASSLERLYNARDQLQFLLTSAQGRTPDEGERAFMDECLRSEEKFIAAMDDDLNTADALAALFELVRAVYKLPQGGVSREAVQLGMDKMKAICGVLGLLMKEEGAIPAEVQALVDERAEARKNKDWKRSDELRDQIKALGYILEDTKAGQKVRKGGA